MSPTIQPGDSVKLKLISSRSKQIGRFSIVAFSPQFGSNYLFAFRVVGLPGEEVSIENEHLKINGHELKPSGLLAPSYYDHLPAPKGYGNRTWNLSDRELFVLGDNLTNAYDSRYIGPVQLTNLVGVITAVKRANANAFMDVSPSVTTK